MENCAKRRVVVHESWTDNDLARNVFQCPEVVSVLLPLMSPITMLTLYRSLPSFWRACRRIGVTSHEFFRARLRQQLRLYMENAMPNRENTDNIADQLLNMIDESGTCTGLTGGFLLHVLNGEDTTRGDIDIASTLYWNEVLYDYKLGLGMKFTGEWQLKNERESNALYSFLKFLLQHNITQLHSHDEDYNAYNNLLCIGNMLLYDDPPQAGEPSSCLQFLGVCNGFGRGSFLAESMVDPPPSLKHYVMSYDLGFCRNLYGGGKLLLFNADDVRRRRSTVDLDEDHLLRCSNVTTKEKIEIRAERYLKRLQKYRDRGYGIDVNVGDSPETIVRSALKHVDWLTVVRCGATKCEVFGYSNRHLFKLGTRPSHFVVEVYAELFENVYFRNADQILSFESSFYGMRGEFIDDEHAMIRIAKSVAIAVRERLLYLATTWVFWWYRHKDEVKALSSATE